MPGPSRGQFPDPRACMAPQSVHSNQKNGGKLYVVRSGGLKRHFTLRSSSILAHQQVGARHRPPAHCERQVHRVLSRRQLCDKKMNPTLFFSLLNSSFISSRNAICSRDRRALPPGPSAYTMNRVRHALVLYFIKNQFHNLIPLFLLVIVVPSHLWVRTSSTSHSRMLSLKYV